MPRYRMQVPDIEAYDIQLLQAEIAQAGLAVVGVYIGSSQLIIEVPELLSASERDILRGILTSHLPIWFTWVERGATLRQKVSCAEDVDRITAMRIRGLFGDGMDPVQGQLRAVTVLIMSLYKNIATATSLGDLKTQAQADASQWMALFNRRQQIIQEGKDFKQLQGF